MTGKMARMLLSFFLISLGVSLVSGPIPATLSRLHGYLRPALAAPSPARTVFLGCDLDDEQILTLTACLSAAGHSGPFLLDSPGAGRHLKRFLAEFQPEQVIPVGTLSGEKEGMEKRLGVDLQPLLECEKRRPVALWKMLFPEAERVVVCPAEPRRLLLHGACLSGALGAPLYVVHEGSDERELLRQQLSLWRTKEVYAVGEAGREFLDRPKARVIQLADEDAVSACYLRQLRKRGPIDTLVVANPADVKNAKGDASSIAPWIALQRRAALLLTNVAGDDVRPLVEKALKKHQLQNADSLILVASLKAIPPERRTNPVPGKDEFIEMEPTTPAGSEPYTFATGRLFHKDAGAVALTLARQRLLTLSTEPRKALIVSNPAGGLPLLETFSRNTAKEMHNAGYQTTTRFGDEVKKDELRRLLPEQDIFLWEGHHATMVRDYEMPTWSEPLRPSLVFLQSCLALCEPEAGPMLERGAVAIVGSSTRTYSASGGACSLAFFDALLYEHQTLGGSLRQAKNFLLAYSLLKEKRLGEDAKLLGANVRSAWAFTLWGDPTLKLPGPERHTEALAPVRHEVHGKTILLSQPDRAYDKVVSPPYQTHMLPNARLAGLLYKDADSTDRRLAPFLFAEVHLPKAPPGKTPALSSRVPEDHWVFCWDPRRQTGYLLVMPRTKDRGELKFHIEWESPQAMVLSP